MDYLYPILSGSLAGSLTSILTTPMDLARTRLAQQGELQRKGTYTKQINGVFDALKKTIRHEGPTAIYKGFTAMIGFQIVLNGIRLGTYHNLKSELELNHYHHRMLISSFAGYISGYFFWFLRFYLRFLATPFNLIKTRLMLQSNFLKGGERYHYTGLFDGLKQIYLNERYI